jgi:drug/metabolite transporter (DMT)-like permease
VAGADVARLLALAALWGGSFAFMRVAAPALGGVWLALCRVFIAFLTLAVVALLRGGLPRFAEHRRAFAVVGILNTAVPFTLFAWAAAHLPASTGAMLNATSPFFATIVAAIALRERITAMKIAGMLVGFAGVALLVGHAPAVADADMALAVVACLVASLCYGVASVYARRRLSGIPIASIALYSQMIAAVALIPALAFAPLPHAAAITPLVAANVAALGVVSTALAYLLYFRLIADLGPARALTVTFLIPMFGVAWGFLFLGEDVGPRTLAACALIVCGTWLAVRQPVARAAGAAPTAR